MGLRNADSAPVTFMVSPQRTGTFITFIMMAGAESIMEPPPVMTMLFRR